MNEVATVEVAALDVATVAADDAIAPDEVVADWVIIPHWPGIPPPPQVAGALHNPHATTLPQPSEIDPQLAPVPAQLFGAHVPRPQTSAVPPPPQVSGDLHSPHDRVPPQPSGLVPQLAWRLAQVAGTHGGPSCTLPVSGLVASRVLPPSGPSVPKPAPEGADVAHATIDSEAVTPMKLDTRCDVVCFVCFI